MKPGTQEPVIAGVAQERRAYRRYWVHSLFYVGLGEKNGGIALNISEGGLAVRTAAPVSKAQVTHVHFQLPQSETPIDTNVLVAWTGESGRVVGLRFADLSRNAHREIVHWISHAENVERTEPAPERRMAEQAQPEPPPSDERNNQRADDRPVNDRAAAQQTVIPPAATHWPVRSLQEPRVQLPNPLRARGSLTGPLGGSGMFSSGPYASGSHVSSIGIGARRKPARWPSLLAALVVLAALGFVAVTTIAPGYFGDYFRRAANFVEWAARTLGVSKPPAADTSSAQRPNALVPDGSTTKPGSASVPSAPGSLPSSQQEPPKAPDFPVTNGSASSSGKASPPADGGASAGSLRDSSSSEQNAPIASTAESQAAPAGTAADPARSRDARSAATNTAQPATGAGAKKSNSDDSSGDASSALPAGTWLSYRGSSRVLNVPEVPVSASGAVATSYRLSIPLIQSSSGEVKVGELVSHVDPAYPAEAIRNRIQGTVVLLAVVGSDGTISSIQSASGPAELIPSARSAVRQWVYSPTMEEGVAVPVQAQITIVYRAN